MKIATWNVNSIRARKDRVFDWLSSRQPDVVCLQETKVIDEDFPKEELSALGYQSAVFGQKSYNGVAILAQSPLEDVRYGFDDGVDDPQARAISATVDGIRIVGVYVPNGKAVGTDSYEYKLKWMSRLRNFLERYHLSSEHVLLCGDFNVAPEDRDVWDPIRWQGECLCSEPERRALARVVEWGFTDAFRHFHKEEGLFSWWDYRQLAFPKKRGLRIDHIYVTQPLLARCLDTVIDREARKGKQPSDHAPVIATFAD